MNTIMTLAILAVFSQFIVEQLKTFIPDKYRAKFTPIVAATIGITLSVTTKVGLLASIGIPVEPIMIDYLITGIAIGGNAVAFNELIKLISEIRPSNMG